MENIFFHSLQNNNLQVPCIRNDFIISIISAKVRNVLNKTVESRAELVQNAYSLRVVHNAPCTLPPIYTVPHRSLHAYKNDAIRL